MMIVLEVLISIKYGQTNYTNSSLMVLLDDTVTLGCNLTCTVAIKPMRHRHSEKMVKFQVFLCNWGMGHGLMRRYLNLRDEEYILFHF